MEETLYFKPETSGNKKRTKEKKKDHKLLKLFSSLLLLLIIILIVVWLLRGTRTVSGRYPENLKNEYVECISNDITYDKANEISSDDKELKISMIFYGDKEFNSANLKYTLHFSERLEAAQAESLLHAQFAKNLAESGYSFEKFSNKFSIIDSDLVLTLHTSDGKMDDRAKSYFVVDGLDSGELPVTLVEYKNSYEAKGFSCKTSLEE
ncbi:hypothetical protein IJI70_02890 [Candidatus Saccharibacteria bacterium]|nr:hypothetical protein [Candidatus Saccharibacteria bacterium]